MNALARGASTITTSFKARLHHWRQHHAHVARESLGRLVRQPVSSLMTIAVIAIALALPLGLYALLSNAREAVGGLQNTQASISLYLHEGTTDTALNALAERLLSRSDIARVETLTSDQALTEFRQLSGYGDTLDLLGNNPLPPVLTVTPRHPEPDRVADLQHQLAALPEVAQAQADLAWVQRLAAIMELGQRLLLALALGLALAVLLVVGNTIRLAIESRRDEILIMKLLGATNGFVRRPFLYMGLWSGLGGGLAAGLLVTATLAWLNVPVTALAQAYQSHFSLSPLTLPDWLSLLALATSLGWIGAFVAVGRHLRTMEPH